jgi:hypothetical protein
VRLPFPISPSCWPLLIARESFMDRTCASAVAFATPLHASGVVGERSPAYLFAVRAVGGRRAFEWGNPLQIARVVRTGCGARWQIFKVGLAGGRGDWGKGRRESPERDPASAKRGSYDRWTTDREKSMGALVRKTAQLGEVVEVVFDKALPASRWPSFFAEDLL